MYRETAKSEKAPIMLVVLWFIFIYVFYICWGIGEILLEVKTPFYVKHIILFAISTYLVCKIISKFIAEYDYEASKSELTVTKRLGRKQKLVCRIQYKNIDAIYNNEEKEKIKEHNIDKKTDITRAYQSGRQVHIVYRLSEKTNLVTLKASRKMVKLIRDYTEEVEATDI